MGPTNPIVATLLIPSDAPPVQHAAQPAGGQATAWAIAHRFHSTDSADTR